MDWLWQQAEARPNAPAVWDASTQLSYHELALAAARGAGRLAALGIRPGARLLWEAHATVPALCWLHAALWAGTTLVPFRPGSEPSALRALTARTGAAGLLSAEGDAAGLVDCLGVACADLPAQDFPARPPAAFDPDRVITLMATSGSGGPAKLVPLRARHHATSVRAISARLQLSGDDRWLVCLPLHHVGGLAIVLRSALTGACFGLHERFDADAVAAALAGDSVSHLSLVPTMLMRLVEAMDRPAAPSLRCVLVGGAPADPALLEQARAIGLPVVPTWGMTEAASQLATPSLAEAAGMDFSASSGRAGRPLEGVELHPADGREAELRVRAPMLFDAYLDSPGGPDADGWFATGDRGYVDRQGRVWIVGRLGDRIISGGENIDGLAVESALRAAGLVEEVRVLGLPDEEWGERVAAVVVSQHDVAALSAWARAHLEPQQRPRQWAIVDRLPRTDSGKPDRDALIRMLLEP